MIVIEIAKRMECGTRGRLTGQPLARRCHWSLPAKVATIMSSSDHSTGLVMYAW